MKQGILKPNNNEKTVPGFPAFELDGKWEHDSIGAPLDAETPCWTDEKTTSNGRLVIQFRNKRGDKICTFAVEPKFFASN